MSCWQILAIYILIINLDFLFEGKDKKINTLCDPAQWLLQDSQYWYQTKELDHAFKNLTTPKMPLLGRCSLGLEVGGQSVIPGSRAFLVISAVQGQGIIVCAVKRKLLDMRIQHQKFFFSISIAYLIKYFFKLSKVPHCKKEKTENEDTQVWVFFYINSNM